MTIGGQEVRQSLLEARGQAPGTVVFCKPGRWSVTHQVSRGRIGVHLLGQRPKRQIHFGGGIGRRSPQHNLPFALRRQIAEEEASQGEGHHAAEHDRRGTRQQAWDCVKEELLDGCQAGAGQGVLPDRPCTAQCANIQEQLRLGGPW